MYHVWPHVYYIYIIIYAYIHSFRNVYIPVFVLCLKRHNKLVYKKEEKKNTVHALP